MKMNSIFKLPIKLIHIFLGVFGVYVTRTEKHAFQELGFILFDNIVKNSKSGVLHIGAHLGQEAESYDSANAKVIWVEAIPDVFKQLEIDILVLK